MQWSEFSFILKPSVLGGIGVFATHDIPVGTQIFNTDFDVRALRKKNIPNEFLKYCINVNDDEMLCPSRFDRMGIGWYINHSDKPNLAKRNATKFSEPTSASEMIENIKNGSLVSIMDIRKGDEILMDYNSLGEPESLKDDYYRQQ